MKKTALFALTLLALPLLAQNPPEKKIDISKLPAQSKVVDDVVVPIPSEIFGVLDRIGKPAWSSTQRPLKGVIKPFGPPVQQAFYFGTVIAEGFIAVEAKDAPEVVNIGRTVTSLGEAFSVRTAVIQRANAIITAANGGHWREVRGELDGAQSNVKEALRKLKGEEMADLISLGGWLRGTEALCDVVGKDYTAEGADLLHQPALVAHFTNKLANLKPRNRSHPLVLKAQAALKAIAPLMESPDQISEKTVKQISDIARELIKEIQAQPK